MLFTQHFALIYEAHTSLAFTLRHPPSSPLPLSPLPSHWTICVVTHAEDRGRKPALSTSNQVIYQISIDCCSSFHGEETTRGRGRGQESMALRCGGGAGLGAQARPWIRCMRMITAEWTMLSQDEGEIS